MFQQKDIDRFWALIDKGEGEQGCWFPLSYADYDRTKQWFHTPNSFSIKGVTYSMHKFVFLLTYGDVPEGLMIRHRCGYGCCVNPAHLTVGTFAQNAWDRDARNFAGFKPGQIATYEDIPEYIPPLHRIPLVWPKVRERIAEQVFRGVKAGMSIEDLRAAFEQALFDATKSEAV